VAVNAGKDQRREVSFSLLIPLCMSQPMSFLEVGDVRGRWPASRAVRANLHLVPVGVTVGHHNFSVLQWHAGPKNGPVTVTGADVAEIIEGKIARLWVMLNPSNE
jgi:hypothetical protein